MSKSEQSPSEALELDCPNCGKKVLWNNDHPWRPFCSERCQQIDFGDWASENHAIPGEPVLDPDALEDTEETRH